METIDIIKNACFQAYQPLQETYQNGAELGKAFTIDLGLIDDYSKVSIRHSQVYGELFAELKSIQVPVLYWFEIVSLTTPDDIKRAFNIYKALKHRNTPAIKLASLNNQSNILYVGKVKKNFWGRLVDHLGYSTNEDIQGLQLYHWAKSLNLTVRVHYYKFDMSMGEYMTIVEKGLAEKLQPLIGKHL